ncbi:hypothetical protein [Rhodococcus chondri]|uniref:DUF1330 domain-containing protein n=1 Tax=Rhodococcus chondri TaxID=3065941 RepID=A0ABU7JQG1_9NOCA|nr:hypothetical protein [Rhodococcus sp. CC-R104]MEE2032269.1 hypothetical protein [Rhodococcus sp. CC-R104]
MSISLCVLLWPKPGMASSLTAYEDKVLRLIADHGGRLLQRAITDGAEGHPLEVQMLTFESQDALDGYMSDERRLALAGERDRAVARTEMMRVSLL